MSKYFEGKIKVLNDEFCFPVDPVTLEATACGYWEGQMSYSWRVDLDAVETISYTEWQHRKSKQFEDNERRRYGLA